MKRLFTLAIVAIVAAGCSKNGNEPPPVAVSDVTLNKTTLTVAIGYSETLTATVLPEDAADKSVTWESDKPLIASVDDDGKVTGVAVGEAKITVTTINGKTATCEVEVVTVVESGTAGELSWNITSGGTLSISGEGKMDDYACDSDLGTVNSPWYIHTDNIKTVVIGDGVESIGQEAFAYLRNLASVTIGNSVKSIGQWAFRDAIITEITIPASVKSIGDYAFNQCLELKTVTLGSGVTTIGNGAFAICLKLANINIPSSVKTIEIEAFNGCEELTTITIPEGVEEIGEGVFIGCSKLAEIEVSEDNPNFYSAGVALIDKTNKMLLAYPAAQSGTSYTVPDGVETIGEYAFSDCQNLTSVVIGNDVKAINYSAFSACRNLESVSIGNGIGAIGDWAFAYCNVLTSVTIHAVEPPTLGSSNFSLNGADTLYVPAGSLDAYAGWGSFNAREAIPDRPHLCHYERSRGI